MAALGNASQATRDAVDPNTLMGATPITVFAPLDNAFATQMIDPATTPAATLDAVLGYHVIPAQVLSTDLAPTQMVTTASGETLTINRSGTTITIIDNQGGMGQVDMSHSGTFRTLSGVVHVIDRVLLP